MPKTQPKSFQISFSQKFIMTAKIAEKNIGRTKDFMKRFIYDSDIALWVKNSTKITLSCIVSKILINFYFHS